MYTCSGIVNKPIATGTSSNNYAVSATLKEGKKKLKNYL